MSGTRPSIYTRLAAEADDHELSILERIAEQAGVIWLCPDTCRWVNLETDFVCGCGCKRSKDDAEKDRTNAPLQHRQVL